MDATWKTRTAHGLLRAMAAVVLIGSAGVSLAPAQAARAPAAITVVAPADAEIFFDGAPTSLRGTERLFVSPELEPGKAYSYEVLARWKEKGQTVERTRTVAVSSGARVRVSFLDDPASSPKPAGAVADKQIIDSRPSSRPTAASVKFGKQLGLNDPALATLGSRIDAARRAHDPVALALAASELAAAEKVAGKKASLTSMVLASESAELAGLRRQETELRSVLAVQEQIAGAKDTITTLRQSLADAQAQSKADSEAIRRSQEPTGGSRILIVNNNTAQYVDFWVNGYWKGQVMPGFSELFVIEHRRNPTVLTGQGDEDDQRYGPVNIWGRFNKYTWNIN
jgi:uncharacterized protein (TIGR03000 family)